MRLKWKSWRILPVLSNGMISIIEREFPIRNKVSFLLFTHMQAGGHTHPMKCFRNLIEWIN